MGTDVTMMVEARLTQFGKWRELTIPIWPDETEDTVQLSKTPVFRRNYELFSMLADVRNRSGRGTKTMMPIIHPRTGEHMGEWEYDTDDGGHDTLIPVSIPKGVPEDATDIWKDWLAEPQNNETYHDHSYLSYAELLTGDWDQTVFRQGIISPEQYEIYLKTGRIQGQVARGVGGEGTRIVNEVEYAAGVRGEDMTAIDLRWREGIVRQTCPNFMIVMNMLDTCANTMGGPENVRLVFAFDS